VIEARTQAFEGLYQSLGTKEGEKSIYKLFKGRERKTRDLDQVKCIKDGKERVLVQKRDIKDSFFKEGQSYFAMISYCTFSFRKSYGALLMHIYSNLILKYFKKKCVHILLIILT